MTAYYYNPLVGILGSFGNHFACYYLVHCWRDKSEFGCWKLIVSISLLSVSIVPDFIIITIDNLCAKLAPGQRFPFPPGWLNYPITDIFFIYNNGKVRFSKY